VGVINTAEYLKQRERERERNYLGTVIITFSLPAVLRVNV